MKRCSTEGCERKLSAAAVTGKCRVHNSNSVPCIADGCTAHVRGSTKTQLCRKHYLQSHYKLLNAHRAMRSPLIRMPEGAHDVYRALRKKNICAADSERMAMEDYQKKIGQPALT